MSESLGGAVLDLKTDDSQLRKGLRNAEKGAKQLDSEFARTAKNIGRNLDAAGQRINALGDQAIKTGKTLSLRLSAPVAALGGAIIGIAGSFQKEMNAVRAVSGATGADFQMLREQAKALGSTTQFSAGQAAQGMQFLARAGFNANEIVAAMPGTLALAAAGQLELGRAADIASNVLTGMRLETDQAARVADVLAKAAASANTDVEQLGEAMKFVAPVAAEAGFSLEDTAAAIGKLSDAGLQGTLAGTGLRKIMSELITPTSQINDKLKEAGVSATDAAGNMLPLAQVIGNVKEAGITGADAMALFGERAGPAMAVLLNEGEASLAAASTELQNAGGTADRLANVQLEGLFGAFTELKSALEGLAIAIADSGMLDFFERMIDKTTVFVRNLSTLNPEVLRMGTVIGGIAIALGPALIAIGVFTKLIGLGTSALGGFIFRLASLPALLVRFSLAMTPAIIAAGKFAIATLPITLTIIGISAALAAGFVAWQLWSGGIMALALPTINLLRMGFDQVKIGIASLSVILGEFVATARGKIESLIKGFKDFIKLPATIVKEWTKGFVKKMGDVFDDVLGFGLDFVAGFATLINKLPFVDINVDALRETLRNLPAIVREGAAEVGTVARGIGEQVVINFQEGQRQAALAQGEEGGGGLMGLLPTPESLQERFAALFSVTVEGQTGLAQAQTEAQQQGLGVDPATGEKRTLLDMFFPSPSALKDRIKELSEATQVGNQALMNLAGDKFSAMTKLTAAEFNFQEQTATETYGSLLSELAKHSKAAFKIQQAAAIANAIVTIAQGMANALSLGFPQGLAAAAIVGLKGANLLSTIKGASFGGGGSSPSAGGGGGGTSIGNAGGGIRPETAANDEEIETGPAVVTVRVSSDRSRFTLREVEDMMDGIGQQVKRGGRIPKIRFED